MHSLNSMKIINLIISKLKGERFELDENIPMTYLLRFFLSKIVSLVWGCIRLRTIKRVFVHPSCTIKCSSKIHTGKNFSMAEECYLNALSKEGFYCGDNVSMGFHTHIELTGSMRLLGGIMKVGNRVGLGSHGHYGTGAGTIEIGDDCIFGNYVSIHPENHNYADHTKPIRDQGVNSVGGVKIGSNCWIGAKVTILDGTQIGNGCIVAAGAVVRGKFPDNVIIGGVPAKIIKSR